MPRGQVRGARAAVPDHHGGANRSSRPCRSIKHASSVDGFNAKKIRVVEHQIAGAPPRVFRNAVFGAIRLRAAKKLLRPDDSAGNQIRRPTEDRVFATCIIAAEFNSHDTAWH